MSGRRQINISWEHHDRLRVLSERTRVPMSAHVDQALALYFAGDEILPGVTESPNAQPGDGVKGGAS